MMLKDKWVLITGASSGLGMQMAKHLTKSQGANVILTARNLDKLKETASWISQNTAGKVEVLSKDLTSISDVDSTIDYCINKDGFYGAILNAGATFVGNHINMSRDQFENLINLNIVNTSLMLTSFVRHFEKTKAESKIMVVSSMAAKIATPYQALYSGTKAFLTNFSNALSHELKNPLLSVSVYSPGGIKTNMTDIPEFDNLKSHLMNVETAAKEGIYCYMNSKYDYVPGLLNKVGAFASKIISSKFISTTIGNQYKKSIQQK